MRKSTQTKPPGGTPAPAVNRDDARAALTAAGQQYAASTHLSPQARHSLGMQVREAVAILDRIERGRR